MIGDAGGFASGLTGEGMYFAIKSGEDVANKIINKDYEYKYIPYMLNVKKMQEFALRSTEIDKTLSEIELELMAFISKSRIIDKELFDSLE